MTLNPRNASFWHAALLTQYSKAPGDSLGNVCRHREAAIEPNAMNRRSFIGLLPRPPC